MPIARNSTVDYRDLADASRRRTGPVHPGRILKEDWLDPMGITAYRLAKDIKVPLTRVAAILAGKRAVSADTALRLARYFGTDAQSWVNLQAHYDLEVARRKTESRVRTEVRARAA
ncbi:MAG: HigA family addiction module antidote protein [Alphaproteobacteria bacterium]|nr:HigA family addiction module antidote protein [Alphaproteobacteria bacterium]MBM3950712.1 HigA family addiction module antidote protein [Rhodospirillales bacterium]